MERAAHNEHERERERAGIAWALADLEGLLARGVIEPGAYAALRHDYDARLRWLQLPATVAVEPAVAAAPDPDRPPPAPPASGQRPELPDVAIPLGDAIAPTSPASPAALPVDQMVPATPEGAVPPPSAVAAQPAGVTNLWINLLLFLGAFFVVIAALIFVATQWAAIGAGAKAGIMIGFTLGFIGAGLVCVGMPKVRPAGHTFLAIGAILLPLDIVGGYNLLFRDQGLSAAATWAWGSLICALFYGALAGRGLGKAYAVAAILAAISAWWGTLAVLDVPTAWLAAAFSLLPLLFLLAARLLKPTAFGRATFGPTLAWAAHLLIPVVLLLLAVYGLARPAAPGTVVAFALVVLFYVCAAASQPEARLRALHVAAAWGGVGALGFALGWWADIPLRGHAAIVLSVAWLALAVGVGLRYAGAGWRYAAIVSFGAGWVAIGALVIPWGFLVRDTPAYWTLIFAGALLYAALQLWGFRQPLMLYPLALAAVLTFFHLLALGPQPGPYGYAWAYTLLSIAPAALLQPLRLGGAARSWDRHLVIIGQTIAIGAAITAWQVGDPFQLAAILVTAMLASVLVASVERRPELLILPNLWGLVATAAIVRLAGSGPRWAPASYSGLGLVLAIGLQAWRNIPAARRDGWFIAHRLSAGMWAVAGPLLVLVNLAEPLSDSLAHGELERLVFAHGYGPGGLAVALCGAALAADAVMTLRRPTGYSASAMIALAILMGIARISPDNPQAYAIPLGLYLLALSVYVAYERDLGPMRMPAANTLLSAAIVVILGTTFLQSLGQPWRYIALGVVEGLVLLGATAFLRRRYGVALTVSFLVLIAFRAIFDVARALPNWALFGLVGLTLLGAGVLFLLRRDRLEAWSSAALQRWSRLT